MLKFFFTLIFIVSAGCLFAQYVHYSDTRNINGKSEAARPSPKAAPNVTQHITRDTVRDTVKVFVHDTIKVVIRDTVRLTVRDTVRLTARDTLKIIVHDTVRVAGEKIVYHKWPDKCPGLSGAVPVLTNYVPKEIVPKITEIYKGHLYSITSIKVANNKLNYKLKVCENGEIKFEYADENGDIISK